MKAVTWHAKPDVQVDTVPDPTIEQPTDAIIRVTSTNICGSDLHLYETLGAFMGAGDIMGREPTVSPARPGPAWAKRLNTNTACWYRPVEDLLCYDDASTRPPVTMAARR